MKDLAHHLKQLNRRIIRSAHREEMEEEAWDSAQEMTAQEMAPPIKKTATKSTTKKGKRKAIAAPKKRSAVANKLKTKQLKKQAKNQVTKAKNKRASTPKTPEEKNRLMKKRVPVFDRNNEKPKVGARASKKKTARVRYK